jgi:hypothetical protein
MCWTLLSGKVIFPYHVPAMALVFTSAAATSDTTPKAKTIPKRITIAESFFISIFS